MAKIDSQSGTWKDYKSRWNQINVLGKKEFRVKSINLTQIKERGAVAADVTMGKDSLKTALNDRSTVSWSSSSLRRRSS